MNNKVKKLMCRIFGHKVRCVTERRYHNSKGSFMTAKNPRYRVVHGVYDQCVRCGKKFSSFSRVKY